MTADIEFLREAIDLAASHSRDGRHGPFGAVVARQGKVLGRGWNNVVGSRDPTAHAEITAIRNACAALDTHDLSGCTLYSSCEPCPMCVTAIYWARMERVVYAATRTDAAKAGFDDEWLFAEVVSPTEERRILFEQSMHPEGRAVLETWSRNPGRVMY